MSSWNSYREREEDRDESDCEHEADNMSSQAGNNNINLAAIMTRLEVLENENKLLKGQADDRKLPKAKLPDPEKFSGKDSALFPQFLSKLKAKLNIDGKTIGKESNQIWYAFDRLEGTAAARIHPWMSNYEDSSDFTKKNFIAQLETAFSDPALQQKAIQQLNTIRQASKPFRDFLNEFDRLLLEAQGHEWDNGVKKGYLKRALSDSLRDRLISIEEDDEYDDFCTQVRGVADRLEEYKDRTNRFQSVWPAKRDKQKANPDAMDFEYTRNVNAQAGSNGQQSSKQRARWVSTEELQKRRETGRCVRCGASGHFVGRCPFLPARRPQQNERTRRADNQEHPPELEPATEGVNENSEN